MTLRTQRGSISHDEFRTVYIEELTKVFDCDPAKYYFPRTEIPAVVDRMITAMINGKYDKRSAAIRGLCTRLNIRHTYGDIEKVVSTLRW